MNTVTQGPVIGNFFQDGGSPYLFDIFLFLFVLGCILHIRYLREWSLTDWYHHFRYKAKVKHGKRS